MIFASDLDRTLIYSKRAMEELGTPEDARLVPIERKDDVWIAYMTEAGLTALQELSRSALFIPVTTRTTEQFNRIVIFREAISVQYAITTNGATILHHGKPMEDWTDYISRLLAEESAAQWQLLGLLKTEGFRFNGQLKQVANLFFYYILDSLPLAQEMEKLQKLVGTYGWRISLQGRKLYLIPKAISKGAALDFICRREGKKLFAGAGDSILDWDFLQNCQYRFIPSHGELKKKAGEQGLTFTKNAGILAGEEILLRCLPIFKQAIENESVQTTK